MTVEKEIDLFNSTGFESDFVAEPKNTVKDVLEERDCMPPLNEIEEESSIPWGMDDSIQTEIQDEKEIDIPTIDQDDSEEYPQSEQKTAILLNEEDERPSDLSASAAAEWEMQSVIIDSGQDDTSTNRCKNDETASPAEYHCDTIGRVNEAVVDRKIPRSQTSAGKPSLRNRILCLTLIGIAATGFYLYFNSNLLELTRSEKAENPATGDSVEPAASVPQPATKSVQPSKHDQLLAKVADATQLRNKLLEKRNEIHELILNYHDGIADLETEILQELKKESIRSYKEAIKIKPIRLKMRIIQRRLAYIEELTKATGWLFSGSEELYYRVRKAEVDVQLIEIAGGIDLNNHMKHITATIKKYSPRPDKLAVDILQAERQPLERIWQQVSIEKEKQIRLSMNPKDEIIGAQICEGNLTRAAELTSISSRTAHCLSRMKGSDLFLNGLKTLTPDTAKQLAQWQGNWICLNGISQLSEPVARQLFKWKGNLISLNSLIEFPPDLARHLLKWEGQQLELMGLEFNKSKPNKKTMKYLALWASTGRKLYVPEQIRQKIVEKM